MLPALVPSKFVHLQGHTGPHQQGSLGMSESASFEGSLPHAAGKAATSYAQECECCTAGLTESRRGWRCPAEGRTTAH